MGHLLLHSEGIGKERSISFSQKNSHIRFWHISALASVPSEIYGGPSAVFSWRPMIDSLSCTSLVILVRLTLEQKLQAAFPTETGWQLKTG